MKTILSVILFVLAFTALITFVYFIPKEIVPASISNDKLEVYKLVNEYRKTIIQFIGGIAIALGLYFTWRRIKAMEDSVRVSEEGQITDRFSKAIEQLGSVGEDKLAIRLGGIYALERIAKDSAKDHGPVMEVLTAFVRSYRPALSPKTIKHQKGRSKENIEDETQNDHTRQRSKIENQKQILPQDIRSILTVIERRIKDFNKSKVDLSGVKFKRIELPFINLSGTFLREADLSWANLRESNLCRANLYLCNLSGTNFFEAYLYEADLRRANLQEANLSGAILEKAKLGGANLKGVNFRGADLRGANLNLTDLTRANLWKANLHGANFNSAKLNGVNLNEAILSESKKLTKEQLLQVKTLYKCKNLNLKLEKQLREEKPCLFEDPNGPKACPENK